MIEGSISSNSEDIDFRVKYFTGKSPYTYDNIKVGWWQNEEMNGNGYVLNAKNWKINEEGWFEDGERISDFRIDDEERPPFKLSDVFYDY